VKTKSARVGGIDRRTRELLQHCGEFDRRLRRSDGGCGPLAGGAVMTRLRAAAESPSPLRIVAAARPAERRGARERVR